MAAAGAGKEAAGEEGAPPQFIEHIHKPVGYTPFDVKWVPKSTRLVSLGVHASGA